MALALPPETIAIGCSSPRFALTASQIVIRGQLDGSVVPTLAAAELPLEPLLKQASIRPSHHTASAYAARSSAVSQSPATASNCDAAVAQSCAA
jgi:hypothetical protein